jgi:DNA modification methylase
MSAPRLPARRDAVVLLGDVRDVLAEMAAASVDCCVTSPPCWGLPDYDAPPAVWGGDPDCRHRWAGTRRGKRGDLLQRATGRLGISATDSLAALGGGCFCQRCGAWLGHLGLEPTPELYVDHLVSVFRLVRRALKPCGTLWLNLGDAYFTRSVQRARRNRDAVRGGQSVAQPDSGRYAAGGHTPDSSGHATLKHKDHEGLPWQVALALEVDGWYLRSDVSWSKSNPMTESVQDRPSRSREYVFLLSASARYFYDYATVREPYARGLSDVPRMVSRQLRPGGKSYHRMDPFAQARRASSIGRGRSVDDPTGGNRRSGWTIATRPHDAHFATFPANLVEACVLAGTSERGCCPCCGAPWERAVPRILGWRPTCDCGIKESVPALVLDPFAGSGTTLAVAARLGRRALGIGFNPDHIEPIRWRCADAGPTLTNEEAA